MDDDLETKQQYLRSEIIDQGYDPNDFSAFMSSIKGEDGLNVDNWSFSDLKTVVNQFKSQYSKKQQQESNVDSQNDKPEQIQNNQNNINNQNNVNNQNYINNQNNLDNQNNVNNQNNINNQKVKEEHIDGSKNTIEGLLPSEPFAAFEQIIKTEKLESNEITDNNNLSIVISNPTRVNNSGFFSSSYYQYTVQTNPAGYKVVRKLSDFTFLNVTIPLINAAVFNPVLPHSEYKLKNDSPKKLLYLQNYMNSLVEEKFFRTLPLVFDFLTLPQEKWNTLRQNKYSKIKPSTISKMLTLEGEFHININKNEDNKGMKIKDEINKKTQAFENLNNAMDDLLSAMEKLSSCYKTLSKCLQDLSNNHKDNQKIFGIFNRLSSLSKIRANDYNREKGFLKDELKYFFKFMNKENTSYLKRYEEFKSARDEYKLKYDKTKKLPNKSQKDLDIVKRLRRDYGLQLLMINTEYKKLLDRQANRAVIQFNKYNDNKDVLLQNFNNCMKLLDITKDSNNIIGIDDSQKKEEGQGKEQEKEEAKSQNKK